MSKLILSLVFVNIFLFICSLGNADVNLNNIDELNFKLNQYRNNIFTEKIQLDKSFNLIEKTVVEKRKLASRLQTSDEKRQIEFRNLENQLSEITSLNLATTKLIDTYFNQFKQKVHISERQHYDQNLKLPVNNNLENKIKIIETSLDRIENIIGGYSFEGKAIDEQRGIENGNFVLIGPIVYFSSHESNSVGLAVEKIGSNYVSLKNIHPDFTSEIQQLAETGSALPAMDLTLGDALKFSLMKDSLLMHIKKGGIVIYPIIGLFLVTLVVSIIKFISLRYDGITSELTTELIFEKLTKNKQDKVTKSENKIKGPIDKMISVAVNNIECKTEIVENLLYEHLLIARDKLTRYLSFIAVTAAAAPLLGLLGTVVGMIKTFKLISIFGTGDARALSTGISEALITTEFGLIIAIPTILIYSLLSRMAKSILSKMEIASNSIIIALDKYKINQNV